MPLLDHFHPPLSVDRPWEGVHSLLASVLTEQLNNNVLPPQFVAIPQVHQGTSVEIDVATLQASRTIVNGGSSGPSEWAGREPAWSSTVDWSERDTFEVRVIDPASGARLVAAIELVSPANKDRPATRLAFAGKCAGYLRQGISLIVFDIVTDRYHSLHRELLELLELNGEDAPNPADLYAASYRSSAEEEGVSRIDTWWENLAVGMQLPSLPLWIQRDFAVTVDFESAYQVMCKRLRIV